MNWTQRRAISIAVAVALFCGWLLFLSQSHTPNSTPDANAPARIWTEQDEKNRVLQEESKKRDKMLESIILSACGPSPSNNYPNDSDVPVMHMMYQEEHKAQYDYQQCSARAFRNQEKAEQSKVLKLAQKPD
jgi:hypothetical protein